MNKSISEKEYILEQKLMLVNEIIFLIRENYIPHIKKLSKESENIQLKLLNVRNEILKIDDKLEDILSFCSINTVADIDKVKYQVYNLINEEKAAYSFIFEKKELFNCSNDNDLSQKNNVMMEVNKIAAKVLSNEDLEEIKIRKSFEEMMDNENRNFYDSLKEEEGYPLIYDACSIQIDEEDDVYYQEYKEWRYQEYKKLYKEFYALVNSENVKSWKEEDFQKYLKLREEGSVKVTFCDDAKGNLRIYSKYNFYGILKNNEYESLNLSKRQLPTEVFKYLISNNIIKEEDFSKFKTNQFGRTFESKMGDIVFEKDLPIEQNRLKRYNKVDFSQILKSSYKGVLYISNQWSEESISKYIDYIRKHYNDFVLIEDPHKKLFEEIKDKALWEGRYVEDTNTWEYKISSFIDKKQN